MSPDHEARGRPLDPGPLVDLVGRWEATSGTLGAEEQVSGSSQLSLETL